jgi:prepilin-type processing-associated H-X9-DG protein
MVLYCRTPERLADGAARIERTQWSSTNSNVGFLHADAANVLFIDGHAESQIMPAYGEYLDIAHRSTNPDSNATSILWE